MTQPGHDEQATRGRHGAESTEPATTADEVSPPTPNPYDDGTAVEEVDEFGAEHGGYGVGVDT